MYNEHVVFNVLVILDLVYNALVLFNVLVVLDFVCTDQMAALIRARFGNCAQIVMELESNRA